MIFLMGQSLFSKQNIPDLSIPRCVVSEEQRSTRFGFALWLESIKSINSMSVAPRLHQEAIFQEKPK
jgi:hypothetical protein